MGLIQPSNAPSAFMSSKNAEYESSMLWAFGPDDSEAESALPTMIGFEEGRGAGVEVIKCGFGFDLETAVSLLTRTDAGTWNSRLREHIFMQIYTCNWNKHTKYRREKEIWAHNLHYYGSHSTSKMQRMC